MKNLDLGFKDVSFKNYLINGAFDFAQRGATWTNPANGTFVADRWQLTSDYSDGTLSFSIPATSAFELYAGASPKSMHLTQSPADTVTTFKVLQQKIESVLTLSGKTATLSFWALTGLASVIQIGLGQSYGTGGSPSSFNQITPKNITLNPDGHMHRYSVSFDIPLASGTVGTDGNDALFLQFFLPINASFDFALTQVMLNEGPDASPFQLAGGTFAGELALCQRYYEKSYQLTVPPQTVTVAGMLGFVTWGAVNFAAGDPTGCFVRYAVPKRIAGSTITIISPDSSINSVQKHFAGTDHPGNAQYADEFGFQVGFTHFTGSTWEAYDFHFTSDAEF